MLYNKLRMGNGRQAGVTLVEVVIGISIIAIAVVAIGYSVTQYVEARAALLNDAKGAYLAEEGYEIIRAIRDTDWNTIEALTIGTTYYLDVSTTTIAITNTPEIIDTTFNRSFVVQHVYRNASDDIVISTTPGATVDDGSREVEITVGGPNGTSTFEAIITNVFAQ